MKTVQKRTSIPLSRLATVSPSMYPSTNVEHDRNIETLKNYLPSTSTLDAVERLAFGMRDGRSSRALSITGPYGSGKSTMAIFLDGLVSPMNGTEWKHAYAILKNSSPKLADILIDSRKKMGIHRNGLVRCLITSKREPISVTVLRAINAGVNRYFTKYSASNFPEAKNLKNIIKQMDRGIIPDPESIIKVVSSLCSVSPVMILIDEFGKNIQYFTETNTKESDLFLLQQLVEMSGRTRKIPLFMVTLQHMSFDEYSVGISSAERKEWAKVQGRFDDIPFANSPDQTRLLVTSVIQPGTSPKRMTVVKDWARRQRRDMKKAGLRSDLSLEMIMSCYPVHPLSLEVLPEFCMRYGQHERTLLSFMSGHGKYTVATFIDEGRWSEGDPLPTMDLDVLYDYFVSGSPLIHSTSANITRLMEIETIIRDSHGLDDIEVKTLKTIGVLNLISKSGKLRASKNMIGYAIGKDPTKILQKLEKKSIVTYRRYADEYRIWHGTDVNIQAKLEIARKRYTNASLAEMLSDVMTLDPIVAARHTIKTGTMRLFERQFVDPGKVGRPVGHTGYDGNIMYVVGRLSLDKKPVSKKPVIIVESRDPDELKNAAIEARAIHDILDSPDVSSDWVARHELEERLAAAETLMDTSFDRVFGDMARWWYFGKKKQEKKGTASAIVSDVCDAAYPDTPLIYNEMINRIKLSSQGATARNRLLSAMISGLDKPQLGIEGWGPERAMYEAVLRGTGIHKKDPKSPVWKIGEPNKKLSAVWRKILKPLKGTGYRVSVAQIYESLKLPPFGVKDEVLPVLVFAELLAYRDNMALYEHGTFCPRLSDEIAERLSKNPEYFELKYFESNTAKKKILKEAASSLGLRPDAGLLDIVSHLVMTVNAVPKYSKKTKNLNKAAMAARDTILQAVEPDTLLFEGLPRVLVSKSLNGKRVTPRDITNFARRLAKATNDIRSAFDAMLDGLAQILFDSTGIEDRHKLSSTAKSVLESVSDQKMKVFLNAVAADMLSDEDWIKYVAMTLTDIPPADWSDEQRAMFENSLADISGKFKRLASLHFADVSDSFVKPSYQITVTHADGHEDNSVVTLKPQHKAAVEKIAKEAIQDMKKKGISKQSMGALVAALSKLLSESKS